MTGQDLITTSIIGTENFLANNILFDSTDDVITFINNIKHEKPNYCILDYLDEPIGKNDLLTYLVGHKKEDAIIDSEIVESYIRKLDVETVSRIYYKNQLLELIKNNSYFINKFKSMLDFKYTSETPDEKLAEILDDLKLKIVDFCYYDFLIEDRYKRAMKDKRKAVVTIDTDSNFINANKYMETITSELSLNKEDSEQQLTLINIIINITTAVLEKIFWELTTNMGLIDRAKPIINMKQEFLYSRLMLTKNKKNYAGIVTAELGVRLPKPEMDIKGLPILKKTSVPKVLRKKFSDLVENQILKPEYIDLKAIIDTYDEIEESIEESLRKGETKYLLPKNLEIFESYKAPDTIEAIRATLVWNALEPTKTINPPEKINLLKLNCINADDPRLEELKAKDETKYNAIMKTVYNYGVTDPKIDISRFGFNCIAIPKNEEKIPDYLLPFIDFTNMVNVNMQPSYILLESLGVYVETVKTVKYKSNIISI